MNNWLHVLPIMVWLLLIILELIPEIYYQKIDICRSSFQSRTIPSVCEIDGEKDEKTGPVLSDRVV